MAPMIKLLKLLRVIEGSLKKGVVLIIIENSHSGPGAARNSAINATNRNWIAFLDSDDIWGNNKISQIQKSIIDNPEANCFLHWEEYNRINRSLLFYVTEINILNLINQS